MNEPPIAVGDRFRPEMLPWRIHHGLSILRLRVDVRGAAPDPVLRAGDLVLACWQRTDTAPEGWRLHGLDFLCVLRDSEVEVVERT